MRVLCVFLFLFAPLIALDLLHVPLLLTFHKPGKVCVPHTKINTAIIALAKIRNLFYT